MNKTPQQTLHDNHDINNKRLHQEMLASAILRKNLESFRIYCPALYEKFKLYKPQQAHFCIDENLHSNILMGNTLLIKDKSNINANINSFIESPKCIRFSLGDNKWKDSIYLHDFHLERIRQIYFKTPESIRTTYPEVLPCMLFLGVGLGEQILAIDHHFSIHNVFIYEPSNDIFYASLHQLDYEPLLLHYSNNSKSIHFHIGTPPDVAAKEILDVIRSDISYAGTEFFVFERHANLRAFDFAEEFLTKFHHGYQFLGFLEDELIGLKHVISKISQNSIYLNKSAQSIQTPAFIIGSGPSLDKDLDFIRQHQNSAIIFSSSSSLAICHKHGIQPDFHVEIERNRVVVERAERFPDKDFLKKVHLLGVSTLHPDIMGHFASEHFCLKWVDLGTSILSNISDGAIDILNYTHPTSGNGAISFAISLGFTNLILFGLDMGMPSTEAHHSKESLYFEKNKDWELKIIQADLTLKGNFGGTILSTFMLEVAKYTIESTLELNPDVHCYNASDGAFIDGTIPIRADKLTTKIEFNEIDKKPLIDDIFCATVQKAPYQDYAAMMENYWMRLYLFIEKAVMECINELDYNISTKDQLLNMFHTQKKNLKITYYYTPSIFSLLSGTFLQLQNITCALLLNIKDGSEFNSVVRQMFSVWEELLHDSLALCREFLNSDTSAFDYKRLLDKYPEYAQQCKNKN